MYADSQRERDMGEIYIDRETEIDGQTDRDLQLAAIALFQWTV